MLSTCTLKKRSDFLRIGALRISYSQPAFLLLAAPKPTNHPPTRVGYTVTKKLGNAVARNRIKRRLREAARFAIPKASNGLMDYVIIARPAAATIAYDALTESLIFALSKVDKKALHEKKSPTVSAN